MSLKYISDLVNEGYETFLFVYKPEGYGDDLHTPLNHVVAGHLLKLLKGEGYLDASTVLDCENLREER